MNDKEYIKALEEIIETLYQQSGDGKLNQNWIGWMAVKQLLRKEI
jgi:hypothetical protein